MTFLALLLATAITTATQAAAINPQSQPATVKDAEAAMIEALHKHDRAAFDRILDPGAVFFLPTLSQGREAILRSWSIFVIPSNASMEITPTDAVVSTSQDLAYTTGKFVFTVNNSGKVTTAMSGTYLSVWRNVDGKWLLKAFAGAGEKAPVNLSGPTAAPGSAGSPGAGAAPTAPQPNPTVLAASGGGLGFYRFGMPLDEVRKVDSCKPYMDVRTTGGLECPNYMFEGRKINISFIYATNALRRIQLWLYEGDSEKDARKATDFAIEFLKRTAGGAHTYGLAQNVEVNGDNIVKSVKDQQAAAGRGVMTEIQTPSSDSPQKWFCRVSRTPMPDGNWYGVFLFVDPRLPGR